MAKESPRPPSDAELLNPLFAAIGKGGCNHFLRFAPTNELQEIRAGCSKLDELPLAGGTHRELLREFRANTAKRLALREQLKAFREDIEMAGWRRANPDVDETELRAVMQDHTDSVDPAAIEEGEDQNIASLIDQSADYRKRQVRKQAVEPFLRWLKKNGIVSHPQRLPRTRMMKAWFDWLGIDTRLRPIESGIRTIVRDQERRRAQQGFTVFQPQHHLN
jgi:hypothetical protein